MVTNFKCKWARNFITIILGLLSYVRRNNWLEAKWKRMLNIHCDAESNKTIDEEQINLKLPKLSGSKSFFFPKWKWINGRMVLYRQTLLNKVHYYIRLQQKISLLLYFVLDGIATFEEWFSRIKAVLDL